MTSNIVPVANLTGGMVSDKVYSRSDVDNYSSYAKDITNMINQPQGGLASRDGFSYVAEVKDSTKSTRLIPFVFSEDDAYMLEVGDQYIRFYRDNSQILETDKVITAITAANPGAVTTSGAHGYSTGDQIYISEVVGMTELNGRRFTVTSTGANTFTIGVNTSGYTAYSSAGVSNRIYTLSAPWTEAQIWDIDFTQSGNTLIMVNPSVVPKQLVRTTDTNWSLSTFVLKEGPFLDLNTTATTLDPSANTGSVTVTASASLFASTDVGRMIKYWDGADYHYLDITAYTNATEVTATFQTTTAGHAATTQWALGSFSGTTGYPETVAFFEQRLYFAATEYQQDSIWASCLGDIDNFLAGTNDTDAFTITVNSNKYNRIRFLDPSDEFMLVGTVGDLFRLAPTDTSTGITPTTVSCKPIAGTGASNIKPCKSGTATIFSSRTTKKLIEVAASKDGISISNLASLAEHLSNNGIIEIAYQEEPNSIIWMACSDGSLITLTHDRNQRISAWSKQVLGRNASSVYVDSIATIPVTNENQVWTIVERTVDGSVKKFIEYLTPHFFADYSNRVQDARYLDCALNYPGSEPASTLTPGATTGSAITFTAGSSVFTANDVGKTIRTTYDNGDGTFTYSSALIVSYSSGTSIGCDIVDDFASTAAIASGSWTLSTDTYTGMWHLEGETLQVFADGGTHPDITVEDGSFLLTGQYTNVTVGYGYTQSYTPLDLKTQLPQGHGISSKNRVTRVAMDYARSVGGSMIGTTLESNGVSPEDIVTVPVFGSATELSTGKAFINVQHDYQDACSITIKQTNPLPLNITGFVANCEVNSGV